VRAKKYKHPGSAAAAPEKYFWATHVGTYFSGNDVVG